MSFSLYLLALSPEEITGIVAGVSSAIVAIVGAIGKIINDGRRERGHMKCCITGRTLKHKKPKTAKTKKEKDKVQKI